MSGIFDVVKEKAGDFSDKYLTPENKDKAIRAAKAAGRFTVNAVKKTVVYSMEHSDEIMAKMERQAERNAASRERQAARQEAKERREIDRMSAKMDKELAQIDKELKKLEREDW